MKKLAIGNYLTPYLLAACVVMLIVLVVQSSNLVSAPDGADGNERLGVDPIEKVSFNAPAVAAFNEITERPLFRKDRQPPQEPTKTKVAAARPVPLKLHLEGVAITPESRVALLRDLNNNKILHLAKGMKHQGWELTSITDTVATFKLGEQSQEIELKTDRKWR